MRLQSLREVRYASSLFDDGETGELLLFEGGSTLYRLPVMYATRQTRLGGFYFLNLRWQTI